MCTAQDSSLETRSSEDPWHTECQRTCRWRGSNDTKHGRTTPLDTAEEQEVHLSVFELSFSKQGVPHDGVSQLRCF